MDNVTDTTNPGGFNNSRSGVDILFGVIGIIGVIGNLTVCVVFLRTRSLRTLTNYLIVHQAAIDFATCIFITIDFIIPKYSFTSDSMFGEMICRLWKSGYFKWSLFLASSLNLVVITMERYCAIIHPLHHYRLFSTTRVKIMLALVWITALSVKSFNVIVQYFDHGHCTVGKVWPSKEVAQIVSVSNCIVQYFVPLVVMAVAYTRCVLVLRKDPLADAKVSTSAQTNTAKDKSLKMASRNVLKMLVLVFLAYAICWGPNQVMFMLYCVGVNVNIFKTYFQVFIVLGYINTAINPFIYALKYKQFQRGIKLVFCPRSLSLVGDTSNLPTVDRLRSDNRRNPTVTTE